VENLFLSLGAALGLRENQQRFLDSEGFELMLRCLKEQQYAAGTCGVPYNDCVCVCDGALRGTVGGS
jgi:hypothetical protein